MNTITLTQFFKLISYAHTMAQARIMLDRMRELQKNSKKGDKALERDQRYYIKPWEVNDTNYEVLNEVIKTNNIWILLNIREFLNYPIMPTLCYQ